jgi:pimeloyl-ACP methyl ester carboxylesterase
VPSFWLILRGYGGVDWVAERVEMPIYRAMRYVRNLTVKRLPGVSHWVQQDAPQMVNELLQEFLR